MMVGGGVMGMKSLFQVTISLISFGLGNYILFSAWMVLSGAAASAFPEAEEVFSAALSMIPLDIMAGMLLMAWPFYHAWELKKN